MRAILGQQVTVRGATHAARAASPRRSASRSTRPSDGRSHVFPSAARIARLRLRRSSRASACPARARARCVALARAVADGTSCWCPAATSTRRWTKLRALPGIGDWTAQYIAMRALALAGCFPHTDLGVMKALGESRPARVLARGEAWRPWRAYAVMHLWQSRREEDHDLLRSRIAKPARGGCCCVADGDALAWRSTSTGRSISRRSARDGDAAKTAPSGAARAKRELRRVFRGPAHALRPAARAAGHAVPARRVEGDPACRFGETSSYGELATRVGQPAACARRARRTAAIRWQSSMPCHRIVGADGALTGYAGGLRARQAQCSRSKRPREGFAEGKARSAKGALPSARGRPSANGCLLEHDRRSRSQQRPGGADSRGWSRSP